MAVKIEVECDKCNVESEDAWYDTLDAALECESATVHPFDGWRLNGADDDADRADDDDFDVLCPECREEMAAAKADADEAKGAK